MSVAALEERRAKLRDAHQAAQDAQYAIDLEKLVALEEESGFGSVVKVDLRPWPQGAATMVIARVPRASEHVFKRYQSVAGSDKASGATKREAGETFAKSCVLYPELASELYEATVERAPGVLGHMALQLVNAVQGKETEEGK